MRLFPGGIRSAIIDSGMSTQMQWGIDFDRGLVRLLDRIFEGCAADPVCEREISGIGRHFHRLARKLTRDPMVIDVPDFRAAPREDRCRTAGGW